MNPWRTRVVALVAGACSTCIDARGESAPSAGTAPVHLAVDAGPECPDAATFEARVRARVPFTVAPEGAPARHFAVSLRSKGNQSEGVLETLSIDGTSAERRVVGRTCDEVASALALVVSVAIDRGDALPLPAPEPAPNAASPPDVTTSAPPPVRVALPDAPTEQQDKAPGRRASGLRVELGADALFMGGVAPTTLVAASPFLGIRTFAGALPDPAVRVAFEHASTGDLGTSHGTAELAWTAARLDLCPARIRLGSEAGVSPCLTMDAGVLHGNGINVAHAASRSRPWFDLGGTLRVDARVVGPLHVEVAGSVLFPTVRDDFAIDPGSLIHRAPVVAGAGSAGLALLFP